MTTDRPPAGMLLPWLALAAAAILLPWLLFPAALAGPLQMASLAKAALPVLAGMVAAAALARWGDRLPVVPEGDVIHPARRLLRGAAPVGDALARGEALLRAWPVAGLALLVLTATLGLVMMGP